MRYVAVLIMLFVSSAWGQSLEPRSGAMAPAPPTVLQLQPPPVVVEGPFVSVQINTTPATELDILGDAGNEPSIARSMTNPDHFVVGWRQFDSITSNYRKAGYAYTHDGGAVWSGKHVLDNARQGSDPVLVPGPDGEIYYNTYRYTDSPDHTELYTTLDGGLTWDGPFNAHGGDKAWMAVVTADGPLRGAIFQASTGPNNVSFDGGQTWSNTTNTGKHWGTMAAGPDGRVYSSGGALWLMETDPSSPTAGPTVALLNGLPYNAPQYLGSPVNPGGLEGQNNVEVNLGAGPFYGEVCVLQSSHGANGGTRTDGAEVYFAWSGDGGVTFSYAVRVNNDPINTAWHWFATFAIAPNGRIDAVWNDTRDDPDPIAAPRASRLYASYSTDGGRSWAPNFPVSPEFKHNLGYPAQNKLGDYYDMVGDDLGAHIAWAATFSGGQDVYYLRLGTADCDANGVPDEMEIAAGLASDVNGDWVLDACQCLADLNGDGILDLGDINMFVALFLAVDPAADMNGDGILDLGDISTFVSLYLAGCP